MANYKLLAAAAHAKEHRFDLIAALMERSGPI
jgi:hypothetical protein